MKRPLFLAHGHSSYHGRENSVDFVRGVAPFQPDIIELDIRKSRDGVLFCHHGAVPFGLFAAQFLRFFSFRRIRKFLPVNTLAEVLAAIQGQPILCLDLKQTNISAQEIADVLAPFSFSEIFLASRHLSYLQTLHTELGNTYRYTYNWGLYLFDFALPKLQRAGIFGVHLFPWQCSPEKIQKVRAAGLEYWIFPHGISFPKYVALTQKWDALILALDNFAEKPVL